MGINDRGANIMDELTIRAFTAYFKAAAKLGTQALQPSGSSGVRVLDGLTYVVLENGGGLLAVYRVRNDGKLKILRRWPVGLEDS